VNWMLYFTVVLALICLVLLFQIRPRLRRLEEQVGNLSVSSISNEKEPEDDVD